MKYATLVSTGDRIDANNGQYSTAVKHTAICCHCKHPVYWRAKSSYMQNGKQVTLASCWVHFPGSDKSCPLYTNLESGNSTGSNGPVEHKGQREKLLLERFAEVIELALGIKNFTGKYTASLIKLKANCVLPVPRFAPPLGIAQRSQVHLDALTTLLIEYLYSEQFKILDDISINTLNIEAFRFLLIPKNEDLLNQLILVAIAGFQGNIAELNSLDLKELKDQVISFFCARFRESNFHQAYLLLEQ